MSDRKCKARSDIFDFERVWKFPIGRNETQIEDVFAKRKHVSRVNTVVFFISFALWALSSEINEVSCTAKVLKNANVCDRIIRNLCEE